MRLPLVMLALMGLMPASARADRCVDDRPVLDRTGPWQVGVSAGAGIGVFFASHGRLGLSFGRRFLDHLEVELSLHYDGAAGLNGHEETLRVGVLLHVSRRWELLWAWRVGHARFHREMVVGTVVAVSSLVASVSGELGVSLSPAWQLRLAPLAFTGYWNEIWGMSLEPSAGVVYRF